MEIEGFLIYYPVIVLLLATLIAFISRGTKEKKISLTIGGIALALVQISILVAGTDEAGHAFQLEAGRVFQSEAGHPWRQSHGSI